MGIRSPQKVGTPIVTTAAGTTKSLICFEPIHLPNYNYTVLTEITPDQTQESYQPYIVPCGTVLHYHKPNKSRGWEGSLDMLHIATWHKK